MISNITIIPNRVKHGRSLTLAKGEATFENGLIVSFRLSESSKGIQCLWRGVKFSSDEIKKQASNRVLATYVINHCMDDKKEGVL